MSKSSNWVWVFVVFQIIVTGIILFLVSIIFDLTWRDFVPEIDFFVFSVTSFFVGVFVLGLYYILKEVQRLKQQGMNVVPIDYKIKYRTGSYKVFGQYEFQGQIYEFIQWFSPRTVSHLGSNTSMLGSDPGLPFRLLKEKGDQVQVTLKVDPLKPKRYLVLVS